MVAGVRAEFESVAELLATILPLDSRQRVLIPSFNQWPFSTAAWVDVATVLHESGSTVLLAPWAQMTPLADVGRTTEKWANRILATHDADRGAVKALRTWGIPARQFLEPHLHGGPLEPIVFPAELTRAAVRELSYRGSPMGKAMLQVTPERDTPMSEAFIWPRAWVQASARSYAFVYDNVRAAIDDHAITAVIVYNGRFLHDQAARAAAIDAGLPVIYYDASGTETDYEVTDHDIHDWSALQRRMRAMFEHWPHDERESLGARWFEDRIHHVDPHNSRFVDGQRSGEVPDKPQEETWVVYFSSSGDEIVELNIDWNDYFGSQRNALQILAEEVRRIPNHRLIVRSHPHKRHKPPLDVQEWLEDVAKAEPDIHIAPESPIDSYGLMQVADVVVTYGSTSGVEAAYAGKPVIVMGPSAYDELGCATRVRDRGELAAALSHPIPGEKNGALAYGLMAVRRGVHFAHVRPLGDGSFELGGVRIGQAAERSRHLSHAIRTRRLARLIQT